MKTSAGTYILDIWGKSKHIDNSLLSKDLIEADQNFLADFYHGFNIKFINQMHGANLIRLPQSSNSKTFWGEADAAYTTDMNVPVLIRTADCIPILFWHEEETICGGIHAGWRGLQKKILSATIHALSHKNSEHFSNKMRYWVGPFIARESYETGYDTYSKFAENFSYEINNSDKRLLDLQKILKTEFKELGIPEQNISWPHEDTFCSSRFFSHRKGNLGRNIFLIRMANQEEIVS